MVYLTYISHVHISCFVNEERHNNLNNSMKTRQSLNDVLRTAFSLYSKPITPTPSVKEHSGRLGVPSFEQQDEDRISHNLFTHTVIQRKRPEQRHFANMELLYVVGSCINIPHQLLSAVYFGIICKSERERNCERERCEHVILLSVFGRTDHAELSVSRCILCRTRKQTQTIYVRSQDEKRLQEPSWYTSWPFFDRCKQASRYSEQPSASNHTLALLPNFSCLPGNTESL